MMPLGLYLRKLSTGKDEPDYGANVDLLEEKQEEEAGQITSTTANQVF